MRASTAKTIWHRMIVDILTTHTSLDSNEIITELRKRRAYHNDNTLKGYIRDLVHWKEVMQDPFGRGMDSRGRHAIFKWKIYEKDAEQSSTTKISNPATLDGKDLSYDQ